MTRRIRIIVELLAPGLIGTALFLSLILGGAGLRPQTLLRDWESLPRSLLFPSYVLLVAYMLTGIQSILYTLIMEWRFSRGLDPRSWRAVRLSSLLGFASGAVFVVTDGSFRPERLGLGVLLGGLGLVVGFLLGCLVKVCSAGRKAQEEVRRE